MAKFSGEKLKNLITLILVVVGCFLVANYFFLEPNKKKAALEKLRAEQQEKEGAEKQEEGEDVVPVKVMDVVRHDFLDALDALGTIKGGVEFKMTFQIPGILKSVNYREGEKYKKGALLMSLADDDIIIRMRRVESNKNKAQTNVDIVQQKLDEHKKLFSIGAISKTTLDKVELELDSSRFDLEAAELEIEANEAILEKSNMYAISDGMIGELYVEEGEVITANTLIGTHILTEHVKAEFGVIERDVTKVKEGLKAVVQVDAYPNQNFSGVVNSISPIVGGSSRTATISIKLDNKEGLLFPGMFARIRVELFQKRDAVIIPTESILTEETGETFVFVLSEEGNTVKKTPIKVGYSRTDYSQIDEGVDVGQTIAITSISRLKDEITVDVIEKQTLELE